MDARVGKKTSTILPQTTTNGRTDLNKLFNRFSNNADASEGIFKDVLQSLGDCIDRLEERHGVPKKCSTQSAGLYQEKTRKSSLRILE